MSVSLTIDDSTWDYLSTIYSIIKVFEEATTSIQVDTYDTRNLTIPYVCGVSKALEKWKSEDVTPASPLITFGLYEAREKLLQYYPNHIEPLEDLYSATVVGLHMELGVFQGLGLAKSTIRAIEDFLS